MRTLLKRHFLLALYFFITFASVAQNDYLYPRGIPLGEDKEYNTIPQKVPLTRTFYVGMPAAASLKQFAPQPQSQGLYGTCVGWATTYAARTILEAQRNNWTDKRIITQNAFSPTFQYRLIQPENYQCEGAFTSQAIKSLKIVGAVPMKDFSVNDGEVLCPSYPMNTTNFITAEAHKIEDYSTLWVDDYFDKFGKIARVKKSLAEGNPVVISMICPASFDKVGSNGLWMPTESPDASTDGRQHGRHALCVIGYDNHKFGGAFEIQNSWGTEHGNGGYVWIPYADFADFVYQAFELIRFTPPTPEAPYLAGSLRLYDMDDTKDLKVELAEKTRNWNVVGTNTDFTYRVVPSLISGSKMRMYLKSEQPAYVYMLGTGSVDKSVNTLFPVEGMSAAMNYSSSEIALPSEEHYFEMDDVVGKDYIVVIYSKEPLAIENIRNDLASRTGTIADKLKKTIDNILIAPKHIQYSKHKIEFTVAQQESNKSAFAMIIEFEHVSN